MYSALPIFLYIWRGDVVGDRDIIKEDRRVGQLVS